MPSPVVVATEKQIKEWLSEPHVTIELMYRDPIRETNPLFHVWLDLSREERHFLVASLVAMRIQVPSTRTGQWLSYFRTAVLMLTGTLKATAPIRVL